MESQIAILPSIDELPLTEPQLLFFSQNQKLFDFQTKDIPKSEKCLVKGIWTKNEDDLLIEVIDEFKKTEIDWNIVALKVPHRNAKQCRERWTYRLHPSIKKNPFEKWEDDVVVRERIKSGNHWTLIASKLPGRTPVAVKNRWYSVLRHRYHGFNYGNCNASIQNTV